MSGRVSGTSSRAVPEQLALLPDWTPGTGQSSGTSYRALPVGHRVVESGTAGRALPDVAASGIGRLEPAPEEEREPRVPGSARRVKVTGDLYHGRVPDGAVYVGRAAPGLSGSRYANPHRVGRPCLRCGVVHDQAAAVVAYVRELARRPEVVADVRRELAGRDLACWCRTGPCHAEVLARVANGEEPAAVVASLLA